MSLAPKLFLRVPLILAVLLFFAANLFAQNYLPGYQYRRFVQVDPAKITGSHTDFPLLLNVTLNSANVSSPSGYDIAFAIDEGGFSPTLLSHELVSWNDGTGDLLVWVKLPLLNSTNNSFYIYYGNPSITTDQSTTDVWSNDYEAVWQLEDATIEDATSNNNTGTNFGNASFQQVRLVLQSLLME